MYQVEQYIGPTRLTRTVCGVRFSGVSTWCTRPSSKSDLPDLAGVFVVYALRESQLGVKGLA